MAPDTAPDQQRLPTLTDVVHPGPMAAAPPPEDPAARAAGEARLVEQVLADLLLRIDVMLEHRVRDALAPAFARAADALIREMREVLTATLRDTVTEAVERELARRAADR
jgi:hypothetical protein